MAFLVALNQNKPLLGSNGLLPVSLYLQQLRRHFHLSANASASTEAFTAVPTVLWWVGEGHLNQALDAVAIAGLGLSGLLVLLGSGNSVVFFLLWVLYHSLVNVGQRW